MSNPLLGTLLGEGIARKVYVLAPFPDFVVKVQTRQSLEDRDYQNIAEWSLWLEAYPYPEIQKWMAPLVWMSSDGRFLIQERCEKCPPDKIPEKLPKVFSDAHSDNFGLLQGDPVLIDFGRHRALQMAMNAKGMRKVNADLYE